MIPVHELLNRIRWDPEFAKGNFELGYYDRAANRIILVPLKEVTFLEDSPQTFQLTDLEGKIHCIPFHRVREVYKDSQRIWHRGRGLGIFLTCPYLRAIAFSCWNNWGGWPLSVLNRCSAGSDFMPKVCSSH